MDEASEERETLKARIKELEKKVHRAKEFIKEKVSGRFVVFVHGQASVNGLRFR